MSHDNHQIYHDTQNNLGVCIADIQSVLGSAKNDIGALVRAGKTNPMAKYKPVRHSSLAPLTSLQLASTRYGFSDNLPQLDLTENSPQNDWVYEVPRGKAGGTGGADEWYRMLDFDNYVNDACSPLALTVGQLVYDAESQILLFGDGKSNATREDDGTWVADQSLSLTELLSSGASSYYAYYISFLLIDTNDNAKNLLVTNMTMDEFVDEEYSSFIFSVYAEGAEVSGVTYPEVPLLSSSRSGHTFRIIACLLPGNNPDTGYGYAVYTSTSSPAVSTLTPYSLGFVNGCDRIDRTLGSGAFKMDGLEITSVNVTCIDMVTELTYEGYTYRAFMVQVRAVFDTTDAPAWIGTEKTVSGTLTITDGSAFRFGPSPSEGDSSITMGAAVGLLSQQANQDKAVFAAGSDNYLWVMKYNGSPVSNTVTATLEIDYPLDTPISESGSSTIS